MSPEHVTRRQHVPLALWLSSVAALALVLIPRSTLWGLVWSSLGQIGLMVCSAVLVTFFPPRSVQRRIKVLMWVLVVATVGAQVGAVYWQWSADQVRQLVP